MVRLDKGAGGQKPGRVRAGRRRLPVLKILLFLLLLLFMRSRHPLRCQGLPGDGQAGAHTGLPGGFKRMG